MYLALVFFCLTNGQCEFVADHTLTTESECELRNEMVAQRFDNDDNISAYRTICLKIPAQFNARHTF